MTEIGGVIIPSASKAAPPIIAGMTSHFFLRLTNAKSEKIPPSPLLSARKVRITYFIVVCKVSVQMIRESEPIINSDDITLPLVIAFNTYNGDVPISPYIIPRAIKRPAMVTRLFEDIRVKIFGGQKYIGYS